MTLSTLLTDEPLLRPEQGERFVDQLWSEQSEGFAACAFGREPYYDDHGKFSHRRWEEKQYRWPGERSRLLTDALGIATHGGDSYVCPLLMSEPRRRQEHALPGRFAWADIDGERLVWAAGGKLFAVTLNEDGMNQETELHDFNGMTFEPIEA